MGDYLSEPVDIAKLEKILRRFQRKSSDIRAAIDVLSPPQKTTAESVNMKQLLEAAGGDNKFPVKLGRNKTHRTDFEKTALENVKVIGNGSFSYRRLEKISESEVANHQFRFPFALSITVYKVFLFAEN